MKRLLIVLLLLASPAFALDTYDFRPICPGFCGPAAISWAMSPGGGGLTSVEIGKLMDWQHYHGTIGDLREDLQDSPAAHKLAVLKAGRRYLPRTCAQILRGEATPNRTVVLVKPDARRPLMGQHWVVFAGIRNGFVLLHWGNGTIREFTPADFAEIYSRWKPECAYEILPAPATGKATLLNRLWDWIAKKLA